MVEPSTVHTMGKDGNGKAGRYKASQIGHARDAGLSVIGGPAFSVAIVDASPLGPLSIDSGRSNGALGRRTRKGSCDSHELPPLAKELAKE